MQKDQLNDLEKRLVEELRVITNAYDPNMPNHTTDSEGALQWLLSKMEYSGLQNLTPQEQNLLRELLKQNLNDNVLYRIVKTDKKGKRYGTPNNPETPSIDEFNPRIIEVKAGNLENIIISRMHDLHPNQTESIKNMSNEELITFRIDDPLVVTEQNWLST
ncbi:MAG: hypothetical protein EAZ55_07495 [Cytophagales bacterium]|nr:MAG: hypothetical protein EAZ55_07495 [Cytophagales bacterium]